MSTISGVVLADKIAEGKLTAGDKKALAEQKEQSLKKQNIWQKNQEAKKEFGRGFQIELEKENRVKAGLPEYDIQNSNNAPKKAGRGKSISAEEIMKKQKGSEALGELRKKSRAKALAAKAKYQAETQSASGKTIHKALKEAKNLDPSSVKGLNEKELIKQAGEDFKPVEKPDKIINMADDVANETKAAVKETTKKSGGFFSKIGKFFKGKGGKLAIGAAVLALVGGTAAWLINKFKDKKDEAPVEEAAVTETKPAKESKPAATAGQAEETKPAAGTKPTEENEGAKPAEGSEETKPAEGTKPAEEEKEEKDNLVPKDYVVKKGDCVWNIAKQHLIDMNDDPNYKPTDAEILKHTKELMDLNKLEFEPDGYHVMIRPEDKLKLVA